MPHRKRRAAPVRLLSEGRRSQPFPKDPGTQGHGGQRVGYHVGRTTMGQQPRSFSKSTILDPFSNLQVVRPLLNKVN